MQILLDTQVFIWLVNVDSRLGEKSRNLVTTVKNQILISYLSFFEMAIKASLGKLSFDASVMEDLEKMGIVLLPGDKDSIFHYRTFDQTNKDPFDNFLMAAAKANKLKLLTSDHKILETKVSGLEVIDATK